VIFRGGDYSTDFARERRCSCGCTNLHCWGELVVGGGFDEETKVGTEAELVVWVGLWVGLYPGGYCVPVLMP
jgi:hypothetical protein